MQSHKPIAKELKKEIKKYLKQIRITGGAMEQGRESEFIDKYFPSFKEDTKLSMVKELLNQNQKYKDQIEQLEPQVVVMVEIGRNKLYEFLRRCKVLTRQSNFNIPYGKYINNGMFRVITSKSKSGYVLD